ncbi:hypothetical protein EU527_12905 [Candidatus Thorarchaeota archaeon]|nr:MAG: hypothetical protein EU527_12905 [Candidatus Thorarchaeota archaeon]
MLEERLGSLAWSIVSRIHSHISFEKYEQTRFAIEVARLTALNLLLKHRFRPEFLRINDDQILFRHLSFEGERFGLSHSEVRDEVHCALDSYSLDSEKRIRQLSLNDFIELLGQIHTVASYHLPTSLNHGSKQRSLGAYYTPKPIADYITNLTLSPTLEKWIYDVIKGETLGIGKFFDFYLIDPACGTGVFLISVFELVQHYAKLARKKALDAGIPKSQIDEYYHDILLNLYGVDLDLGALEVADLSLRLLESGHTTNISESHLAHTLKRGNSLISLNGIRGLENHRSFFNFSEEVFPFEWSEEFPEVMDRENCGFDFVVMNPPYERLKPNLAEFIRELLLSGDSQIHLNAYKIHKDRVKEASKYFRKSGEYSYATSYALNTYQLFIERALQLTRNGGSIGCIVPSTILCDVSAQNLRNELFLHNNLRVIDSFPETSRIFPDVTQAVSIMIFTKGGTTDSFGVGFNRTNLVDALDKKRMILDIHRIVKTVGPSLMIPQVDKKGYVILESIHQYPSLSSHSNIQINRGELDLTVNSDLYSTEKTKTPLIRGSQISRFELVEGRHKARYVDIDSLRKLLAVSSRVRHIDMKRIACQQISNMNQRWRLKFAPIEPGSVIANSCNYMVHNQTKSDDLQNYLLGIFNSELMNWRFQITNSNNHVSIRELQVLPLIPFNRGNKIVQGLCKAVNDLRQSKSDSTIVIEAYVFALYELDKRKVKMVLEMRNCPSHESKAIIEYFNEIT